MAHVLIDSDNCVTRVAAGTIAEGQLVKPSAAAKNAVVAAATNTDFAEGWAVAAAASGQELAVALPGNEVKVTCVASVGAEVMIASTNGGLGPASLASGFRRVAEGLTTQAALPGDRFSILLRPRELTGTGV
jgi:hypothetical protein